MTAPEAEARGALAQLVYDALRFADWAAGEGFCPEGYVEPADFICNYCDATLIAPPDGDALAEHAAAEVRALTAERERDGEVIEGLTNAMAKIAELRFSEAGEPFDEALELADAALAAARAKGDGL